MFPIKANLVNYGVEYWSVIVDVVQIVKFDVYDLSSRYGRNIYTCLQGCDRLSDGKYKSCIIEAKVKK